VAFGVQTGYCGSIRLTIPPCLIGGRPRRLAERADLGPANRSKLSVVPTACRRRLRRHANPRLVGGPDERSARHRPVSGKSASSSGGPTFREYRDASPAAGSPTCLRAQGGARVGVDSAANRTVLVAEGDGACHQPGPLRGITGRPRIASPENSAPLRGRTPAANLVTEKRPASGVAVGGGEHA
jgi:hypothetical protein